MKISAFASLLLLAISNVNSLNVLGIYPLPGKSHFFVFRVLLLELANKGHNVTVITYFPEKVPPKNYHEISLAGAMETIDKVNVPMKRSYWTLLMTGYMLAYLGKINCEAMLAHERVQNFMKQKPKFDVILTEMFNSDCSLGIAYKLGAPVVATSSHVPLPYHYNRLGITYHPAYENCLYGGGTTPSLYQRVERFIFNVYFNSMYYWVSQRTNQNALAQYFDDIPPLEDLAKDIKVYLVYQHLVLTGTKILPANVIEVNGYHVTKAKPLSGDLLKFIEGADHGVIYINFGSIVKSTSLTSDDVEAILDTINELPQRFIWKWENKTLPVDKSKVYIDSWLPQVDILSHPKVLAFLSHAGMGGTTEAIYHGVPIVAMPVFGDQPSNAIAIEESGFGIQIEYRNLKKETLVSSFKKVLDPKFREQAKEVSAAWHDRPMSPLDTAVFWTEFVARHPTISLRSAAVDVPLYQYLFLDIFAVFLTIVFSFIYLFKRCCGRSKKLTKSQEKTSKKTKKPKRE